MITLFIFMILLNVYSLCNIHEPPNLKTVKEMYKTLRENLPEKFKVLERPSIVTGFYPKDAEIGYNVNKGYEIGLCLSGTPNQMFHVLIHELAHSTVKEYEHSEEFWKNYNELREHCVKLGLYQEINEPTPFCGKYIVD
jgi:hypothetical protein